MRWYRFLPFLLTFVGVFLLTGALRGPKKMENPLDPVLPDGVLRHVNGTPNEQANSLIQRTLTYLADPRLAWLRHGVWMRSRLPGMEYQAEGVFIRAPGDRFRLDVRLQVDSPRNRPGVVGQILAISDGENLWQATRIGENEYKDVQRLQVGSLNADFLSIPGTTRIQQDFYRRQIIRGIEQLLRTIQGQFWWVHGENRSGKWIVTGSWAKSLRDEYLKKDKQWPAMVPRFCRVHLQGETSWPTRFEWWGPNVPGGKDRLMIETEFRDPRLGPSLDEKTAKQLFSFDPGRAEVLDLTSDIRAAIREMKSPPRNPAMK